MQSLFMQPLTIYMQISTIEFKADGGETDAPESVTHSFLMFYKL